MKTLAVINISNAFIGNIVNLKLLPMSLPFFPKKNYSNVQVLLSVYSLSNFSEDTLNLTF